MVRYKKKYKGLSVQHTAFLVKVYFESFVILGIVEVNGWRHAIATLPVRKEVVSIEWEAVWAHELVWTRLQRSNSLCPTGNETLIPWTLIF